jgi:disulfide oxidoreductase YuzD
MRKKDVIGHLDKKLGRKVKSQSVSQFEIDIMNPLEESKHS